MYKILALIVFSFALVSCEVKAKVDSKTAKQTNEAKSNFSQLYVDIIHDNYVYTYKDELNNNICYFVNAGLGNASISCVPIHN